MTRPRLPLWLKFKGGKDVATTLGCLLAWSWPLVIAACLLWLLLAVLFRISSLSALLGLALTAVLAWFFSAAPCTTRTSPACSPARNQNRSVEEGLARQSMARTRIS